MNMRKEEAPMFSYYRISLHPSDDEREHNTMLLDDEFDPYESGVDMLDDLSEIIHMELI